MIKLAVTLNAWLDEELMVAQQLGAEQVVAQAGPGEPALEDWEIPKLAALRNRVEKAGFELLGLDYPQAAVNEAGRGEADLQQEIDRFRLLIVNAGEAGIPLIAYRWVNPQQQWDALAQFLENVVPLAEAKGVRLAGGFHPGSNQGGWDHQASEQFLKILPSPYHGLDLNPNLLSRQNGLAPIHTMLHPDFCKRVFLVTLENDLSVLFSSTFPGEKSMDKVDLFSFLEILETAGSTASVRPGQRAGIPVSTDGEYQEQAYACGYLRAMLQTLAHQG